MGYVLWITELQFFASASHRHCFQIMFYIYQCFPRAIVFQLNGVEKLQNNPLWIRTVESTQDLDSILKAFRNVSSLCEVFQVSFSND